MDIAIIMLNYIDCALSSSLFPSERGLLTLIGVRRIVKKNKSTAMQKTVLEEIINAEKEAEKITSQAQEKASGIISAADTDYNTSIAKAKENAQKTLQDAIHAATKKTEENFAAAVSEAEKENREFLEKSSARTEEIAELITAMLIKPEYERE